MGTGTTFTIYLPALDRPAEIPATDNGQVLSLPRGNYQRIAVIDDEEDVGRIVNSALRSLGYDAAYYSSAEAFERECAAGLFPVSLILTDQTMPRVTGLELARKIRAQGHDFPIVIMSGFARDLTPEALAQVRKVERLKKPFQHRELALLVHRLLPGAEPSGTAALGHLAHPPRAARNITRKGMS